MNKLPFANFQFPLNYHIPISNLRIWKPETHWQLTTGNRKFQGGQALVSLLIFIVMGLAIATAASFIIASNSLAASDLQEGTIARQMADSGIESAYLGILRGGAGYTGETISGLNGGSVVVVASWSGTTATIDSTATNGGYVKKVESVVDYSNNVLDQVSWKEVD